MIDPVEAEIAALLDLLGVEYVHNTNGIDFKCGDIYIEAKAYFAERVTKQMNSVQNIIVFQGIESVRWLRKIIEAKIKP